MAGLFDNIFGGAGGMYADMLSPEQQAAIRKQSMLQMAAKLLEGSGPSPVRRTLGQNLGGALSAGAEAVQSGQTNAVQQMLLKQKLDEAKMERDRAAQISQIFGGGAGASAAGPVTPEAAINAPGAAVGPTAARAATIGTMPAPAANDRSAQAEKYRKAAALYAADPAKAKAYMDIAEQLAPREKFSTTPQFGRSAAGTPISYVLSEDGGMKVLNVQQNPDFTYQDMGGYISVRDKRNNQEVEKIKKVMSPSEAANLSLRMQETDLVESPEGYVRVPKFGPNKGTAMPVATASGAPLSSKPPENFTKLNVSLNEMQRGLDSLRKVVGEAGGPGVNVLPRESKQKLAAAHTSFMMGVKNAFELGVLNGPDLDLIQRLIPDPNMYYSSSAAYNSALDQAQQYLDDKTAAVSSSYGRPLKPVDRPNKPAERLSPSALPSGLGTGTFNVQQYFQPQ